MLIKRTCGPAAARSMRKDGKHFLIIIKLPFNHERENSILDTKISFIFAVVAPHSHEKKQEIYYVREINCHWRRWCFFPLSREARWKKALPNRKMSFKCQTENEIFVFFNSRSGDDKSNSWFSGWHAKTMETEAAGRDPWKGSWQIDCHAETEKWHKSTIKINSR